MRKLVYILLGLCLFAVEARAQSADAAKSISTIKRDTTYLYAEATMKDLDEAILGAKAVLEVKVGDWVRSQYPDENAELCIVKAKEHTFDVQTLRGDYHRAFVYVKKSDIIPVTDVHEMLVFQVPAKSEQTESTPAEVISEEAPVIEPVPTPAPTVTLTADEKQMTGITKFSDIEPYVKDMQSMGRVKAYGKYATMPADDDCHLFVYDRQGSVVAVLRNEHGAQTNLRTLQKDDVKSYKNCGAIWLQLK